MPNCYVNSKSLCNNSAFIFSDFLLVGAYNWDLSQKFYGQFFSKTAIVRLKNRAKICTVPSREVSTCKSLDRLNSEWNEYCWSSLAFVPIARKDNYEAAVFCFKGVYQLSHIKVRSYLDGNLSPKIKGRNANEIFPLRQIKTNFM